MLKKTIIILLLFISSPAVCAYRDFFWLPTTPTTANDQKASLSDEIVEIKVPISGLTSTPQPAKVVYSNCSPSNNASKAQQSKTSWLAVPKEIIYKNGISIDLSIDEFNSWTKPSVIIPPQYDFKIVQRLVDSDMGPCYGVGQLFSAVELYWQDAMLTLKVKKQSFPPGSYSIPITYYYAFEEHKVQRGSSAADTSQHANKVLQIGEKNSFNLALDVGSRCLLSTYGPISLSHGRMTLEESAGNKSAPFNINASCDYDAPIRVKLTGKESVAGKTLNFTKCGVGGMCELTFNGSEYDKIYKSTGNLDIAVTSTFHPIEGKTIEGEFTGGGVLTILFE
ncbi:hypothetical protein [Vibrio sp.]|uniref:hypothetical protein n=1 Tax=Vibrio sp. TaxID=678 RepID=UPI003AA81646